MEHQKVYNAIISKAKLENRKKLRKNQQGYVYYEKHHILPRCLKGTDDEENLVLLTGREHYICHKLLTYIYVGNRKIALAFHKMSFGNHNDKYNISSRDYEYAKKLISITPISEETRKKLSLAFKGDKNPQWGKPGFSLGIKRSNETKQLLRKSKLGDKNPQWGKPGFAIGYKFTEEQKKHCSISQQKRFSKKENHPRFGKHCSEETKNKIRQTLLNKNNK
jgi:hypothetical protein